MKEIRVPILVKRFYLSNNLSWRFCKCGRCFCTRILHNHVEHRRPQSSYQEAAENDQSRIRSEQQSLLPFVLLLWFES